MAKILVVDDHPDGRSFLVTLLGYQGHRIREAADGAAALVAARAERPDLIITDVLMPRMDGYELVRELRADPSLANVPVVFYSAHYHGREARDLARDCGVEHILNKPAEPEEVLRVVAAVLSGPAGPAMSDTTRFEQQHRHLLTAKLSEKVNELEQTGARLQALLDLDLTFATERDPRRLVQGFCDAARELFACRFSAAWITDKANGLSRHLIVSGLEPGISLPTALWTHLESELNGDRARRFDQLTGAGYSFSHVLVAPIASLARVYGLVLLSDKVGGRSFDDEDERLVGMLAAQLRRIYENGSLYSRVSHQAEALLLEVEERRRVEADLKERTQIAELAADIGRALNSSGALQTILHGCTEALVRHLNAVMVRIWVIDEGGRLLQLHASSGMHTHLDGPHSRIPVGEFKIGRIAASRQLHQTNDLPNDSWVTDPDWVRREGLVAFAGYPLLVGETLVGVMAVFSRQPISDVTLQALDTIAGQVALGIERQRTADDLRAAQQRLNYLLQASPTLIYAVRVEGEKVIAKSVSENVQRLTGYTLAECMTEDWWLNNIHDEDRGRGPRTMEQALTQGHAVYEYRFRHKNGTYRWIRDEMRLASPLGVRPAELVGSWSDITERRELEQQFQQSQKMEAIGRLAGGIAHDFNNLLTVILGYGELLLSGAVPPEAGPELIREMVAAGDRAAALTRQLLAFSRQQVVQPRVLDLNSVVLELEKMLRRLIGEDIQLQTHLTSSPRAIHMDAGQVGQVIMNLVVNARDAMPNGGTLLITTSNVDLDAQYAACHVDVRPGRYALLTVTDSGIGMSAEVQARIFEPFYTTKEIGRGTGLGLSTVYGIVRRAGGHIEVESTPGRGTTFRVYFPETATASTSVQAPATSVPRGGSGESVLLVEDDPSVRSLASKILRARGYTVVEAATGSEALQAAAARRFDLLLSDVVMPGMSGPDLAERFQSLCPHAAVLFMSGYTGEAIARLQLDPSIRYLQKPFTPDVLSRKVREVLDSNRGIL